MKKIILIAVLLSLYFLSFSQRRGQNMPVNNLKISGKMYSDKSGSTDIIMQPSTDSLGQYEFKNIADPNDLLDAVNYRTLLESAGYDSLVYESDGYLKGYAGGEVHDSAQLDESNFKMNSLGTGFSHLGDLAEHNAHIGIAYISTGATITDNGDSTVTITESETYIKKANLIDAEFINVIVPETTLTVTYGQNLIIYADYNSGNPKYDIRISSAGYFYNNWDKIPLATVVNIGSKIITNSFRLASTNGVQKNILTQLNTEAIRYGGGLQTSETGTRQLSVSAGINYIGNDYEAIPSWNTSTGDTFTRMYYTTGSGWTRTTGQTTVSNSEYNDISTGLATLTSAPERWANKWLYHVEDDPDFWVLLEGQTAHTSLSAAEAGGIPSILPPEVSAFYAGALLVAKIIVSGNETNIVEIQNPFTTSFTASAATSHNNLSDLYLSGNGITYGHIDDQTQSIYGHKTFEDSIYARTMTVGDSSLNVATTAFVKSQSGAYLDTVTTLLAGKQDTLASVIRSTSFTTDNAVLVVDGSNRSIKESSYTIDGSNYFTGENTGDQQLTTTGSAGQIAINGVNGNSITLNVNDADASATNEFQNLAYTPSPTDGTIGISNGTNATIPLATSTNAGLMPPQNDTTQVLSPVNDTITFDYDAGANFMASIIDSVVVIVLNVPDTKDGNFRFFHNSTGAKDIEIIFTGYDVWWRGNDKTFSSDSGLVDIISYKRAKLNLDVTLGSGYTK